MRIFFSSLALIVLLSGCGGTKTSGISSFEIYDTNIVSSYNPPLSILEYDMQSNGKKFTGYVITNDPNSWQAGVFEQVEVTNIEGLHRPTFSASGTYSGIVTHDGIAYRAVLYRSDNMNIETLMAILGRCELLQLWLSTPLQPTRRWCNKSYRRK